jgi:putative dimethyl sulfoxide reductase chaperone
MTPTQAWMNYYQLTTIFLCEPEKDVLEQNGLFGSYRENIAFLNPEASHHVTKMEGACKLSGSKYLLIEYARLFIGPFKLQAPPYASCYLGNKELNSEITDQVRQIYSRAGLHFDDSAADLPDHMAVETEFLHYLMGKTAQEEEQNYSKTIALLGEFMVHFSSWVPLLCNKVLANTKEEFYKELFTLIQKMVYVKHPSV